MLRELWGQEKRVGWDDAIPDYLRHEWITFFEELFPLENVSIPRCINPRKSIQEPELILFSDASNEAYGAAAYVRWTLTNGTFAAQLIATKNRIALVKIIDIVRLELTGPVLSKRLRTLFQKESRYTFSAVYHIVDRKIVEAVISKNSYGFNTYAANRIGEIQQDTDPCEWFLTAGRLKIEDWLTRGKSPGELGQGTTWQTGPPSFSSQWMIRQSPVKQISKIYPI